MYVQYPPYVATRPMELLSRTDASSQQVDASEQRLAWPHRALEARIGADGGGGSGGGGGGGLVVMVVVSGCGARDGGGVR